MIILRVGIRSAYLAPRMLTIIMSPLLRFRRQRCSLYGTVRGVPCMPPSVFPVWHRQRCSLYATVSVPCMPPQRCSLYATVGGIPCMPPSEVFPSMPPSGIAPVCHASGQSDSVCALLQCRRFCISNFCLHSSSSMSCVRNE